MTVGFTCGTFDLLHPGHIFLLDWAKERCDHLIVGLQTDPTIDRPASKHKPVQTMFERWVQLRAVRTVDEIIPYDNEVDLYHLLATININIRFLGQDYATGTLFTGHDICQTRKIEIAYAPRLHSYSSTDLRTRLSNS